MKLKLKFDKKLIKHSVASFLIVAAFLNSYAQHDFGLKVNGGLSQLLGKINSPTTKQTVYFVPSGQAGAFYNFHLGKKSLLGAELLFVQIEGKEHLESPETDVNGKPTGEVIKSDVWQHISYLAIPIYYGFIFKKININLGFQTAYELMSSGKAESSAPYNGSIIKSTTYSSKLYTNIFDFGTRAGIILNLSNKFSIEANYYYGLNNIHKKSPDWQWKVQQLTLGLRYKFYSNGKKKET